VAVFIFNSLTPELNPSAQRCLSRFLLEILIFKRLTSRRLCKPLGVKGLMFAYGVYNITSYKAIYLDQPRGLVVRVSDY
jgi:hypothetical protein